MDLVSGSSGFIGRRLVAALLQSGRPCRQLRRPGTGAAPGQVTADLLDPAGLQAACQGVERVLHCAGHAHAFTALGPGEAALHWQINHEGSRNLAEAAGRAGVRVFVFLSSVKAMGEPGERCVDEDFPDLPASAYGCSKRAAEAAVLEAGARYGMQVVNLRLAMVYGAGGRGNLERMARLVARGLFPPLPETGNHRSLVHVDDVVAAILQAAGDARAAGRTYIVASREAPSGRALYDQLRGALDLPPRSWSVPAGLLRGAARAGDVLEQWLQRRLPLDSEVLERLLGSAWYSPDRIEAELGWSARVSLAAGLREMLGR